MSCWAAPAQQHINNHIKPLQMHHDDFVLEPCKNSIDVPASCSLSFAMLPACWSIKTTNIINKYYVCLFCWLHLIWMTFDIKVDCEVQFDAFLHRFLQSWDPLSCKLVPGDEGNEQSSRLQVMDFKSAWIMMKSLHEAEFRTVEPWQYNKK